MGVSILKQHILLKKNGQRDYMVFFQLFYYTLTLEWGINKFARVCLDLISKRGCTVDEGRWTLDGLRRVKPETLTEIKRKIKCVKILKHFVSA